MIKLRMNLRKITGFFTALCLGFLLTLQIQSLKGVNEIIARDRTTNIFQEIAILNGTNKELQNEVLGLENTITQLKDRNSALDTVEAEIQKYNKLTGDFGIFGPGIEISLEGKLTTPLLTDLVNEIYGAGGEAVSINEIRITRNTSGIDTLPQGQILINGSILSTPNVVKAIGEPRTMQDILELPGGVLARLRALLPGLKFEVKSKELVQMN